MGLIQDMGKHKGAPKGVKLPQPTTAGDDQLIAAKTGEYVLPPEVVAMIGIDKLDAMVAQMTGKQPGGQPAEMPEGAMHEMMEGEGYATGGSVKGKMQGYARGGLISQIEKGLSNAMTVGASLMPDPVQKRKVDPMEDVRRWMPEPMDMDVINPMPDGLAPQERKPLVGYAEGGIVEDDYTRRKLNAYNPNATVRQPMAGRPAPVDVNALRGYNPQASIPSNATTNASPRAPELRNYTPEAGRVQPGGVTPRISGLAAQAQPSVAPSRTVAELDARAASSPRVETAKQGVQQVQANRLSAEAVNPGKGMIRGLAGAAVVPVSEAAGQFALGEDAGVRNQFYNDPNVGTLEKAKQFGRDAAGIALPSAGAVVGGGAGSVFAPVAGTIAGGVAGYGVGKAADAGLQAALGESALDRYKAGQPQQAPQMTDKERSDETARRRAALEPQPSFEQKIGKFIASERATPTAAAPAQAIAARVPRTGAAKTGRPLAPTAQPAQQPDAGLQTQIDASPIASVQSGPVGPEGANGHVVTYKDGRSEFAQQLPDEAKAWYALTGRASAESPVEIIKGSERFMASPESGFQAIPKFVADAGQTGQYMNAASQGWIDRVAPLAAEARNRLSEINAQGDNSIRVSNATDRDGQGRNTRNQIALIELQRLQQEESLRQKAMTGDPQALQQLNAMRSMGRGQAQDEYAATTRETLIDPTNPMMGTVKEPVLYNKRTGEVRQAGTVQSNSAPAGMKQVGTSGGKPVYQDAQGNRFIGD